MNTDDEKAPDTARGHAVPSIPPPGKTPSLPPPPWVEQLLQRFDEGQETTREVFTRRFDGLRIELLERISTVEQKHDELARRVGRENVTRIAAPFVGIALGVAAFILALAAMLRK